MSANASEVDSRAPVWPAWAFAVTTFLGAFLLFQVQPLIGKYILPWFGGAPAVWTTCLLFFQLALFGEYALSHLLVGRLAPRGQTIAHGVLLLAALAVLPIAPADSWKPTGSEPPTLHILMLLAATVGLPYFVLATTSPLVQSWFARSYASRTPYRLYSLSNIGSLAALLSYPFVFEPSFDLLTQARLWSWCFAVYGLLMGVCAVTMLCIGPGGRMERAGGRAGEVETIPPPPTWLRRAMWLFLPACASLILLATTNHVCQDVAPRPFLWVVPLSLYLLSFVICFDHPRWYVRPLWAVPAVIGIVMVLGSDTMLERPSEPYQHAGASLGFAYQLVLHFGTMFCIAMICHGELARLKPEPARLTEFYLYLAGGGALGGIMVGIAAPAVFSTFLEWNLGMVAAYIIATVVLFRAVPKKGRGRRPALLAAGFAAGGFLVVLLSQAEVGPPDSKGPRFVDRTRNFYGVISVWDVDLHDLATARRYMKHGAILHGEQFLAPEKRRTAFNYYAPESGIARTIRVLQERKPSLRVGVVGLGTGTLAAFARPGDSFTFYEINPAVREMAQRYFYYLSDARDRGAAVDIVMGDARLTLDQPLPSQNFDLLVLDAFSGDSVPVHLLTREAMQIYLRHLATDGAIAIHATNSYLYLFPVARALAEDAGLGWRRVYATEDKKKFRTRSNWVIASGDQSLLNGIPNIPPPSLKDDFAVPAWTDQRNDLFSIMIR